MMSSKTFSIDKEALRKDFFSEKWLSQRTWFLENYKGTKKQDIQDKYYAFLERVHLNIPFFDWFHAYTVKTLIDYPFKVDLIGEGNKDVNTV